MKQQGIVVSIKGNNAEVKFKRESACGGNCGSCGGCDNFRTVTAVNSVNAKEGDSVEIETPSKTVLGAAMAVYVIPLAVLIIGYVLGNAIFKSEGFGILFGFAFMAASYIIISLVSKKHKKIYQPVICRII